jgi:2-polyprenyl-3-methyl-5-hydroxy-6-metoxy-1,4-benzoquinol methylase
MIMARRSAEAFGSAQTLAVLDAGCEYGLFSLDLARRHPNWRIVGVDIATEALDQARAQAGRLGLRNVRFRQADLTQPLSDERFDVVVALECLVEIADHEAAVRTLAGAARPGGLLVLQVPTADWQPVFPFGEKRWRREARHGYAAEELRGLLDGGGFDVRRLSPSMRLVARAAQELRDRWKQRGLKAQLALFPAMAVAAWLDRHGATWGAPRAWYVEAIRR